MKIREETAIVETVSSSRAFFSRRNCNDLLLKLIPGATSDPEYHCSDTRIWRLTSSFWDALETPQYLSWVLYITDIISDIIFWADVLLVHNLRQFSRGIESMFTLVVDDWQSHFLRLFGYTTQNKAASLIRNMASHEFQIRSLLTPEDNEKISEIQTRKSIYMRSW